MPTLTVNSDFDFSERSSWVQLRATTNDEITSRADRPDAVGLFQGMLHALERSLTRGDDVEDQTLEERIRLKAFQLWKQDGSMEGCADEYWRQAREMIEIEVLEENEKPPAESFE